MAFRAYSSKNCKVRVSTAGSAGASIVLTVRGWNVNPTVNFIESTNSEGGGFYEDTSGITKADIQIDLHENGLGNVFDVLRPGSQYAIYLYLNDTNGPFWLFSKVNIASMPNKANVDDLMGLTINGTGFGTFSYPTGNATS